MLHEGWTKTVSSCVAAESPSGTAKSDGRSDCGRLGKEVGQRRERRSRDAPVHLRQHRHPLMLPEERDDEEEDERIEEPEQQQRGNQVPHRRHRRVQPQPPDRRAREIHCVNRQTQRADLPHRELDPDQGERERHRDEEDESDDRPHLGVPSASTPAATNRRTDPYRAIPISLIGKPITRENRELRMLWQFTYFPREQIRSASGLFSRRDRQTRRSRSRRGRGPIAG